jgi:hypothetical protein
MDYQEMIDRVTYMEGIVAVLVRRVSSLEKRGGGVEINVQEEKCVRCSPRRKVTFLTQ